MRKRIQVELVCVNNGAARLNGAGGNYAWFDLDEEVAKDRIGIFRSGRQSAIAQRPLDVDGLQHVTHGGIHVSSDE